MPLSPTELASRILKLPPDQQKLATQAFKMHFEGKLTSPKTEAERDFYLHNPVKWVEDKLKEYLWSKQRDMMNSVRDNRRTAVYSCHRIGKSMVFGRVAHWWINCHKPGEAIVVTSAHSATQVKMALWREMGRVHAKGKLPGRMNLTEYWLPMRDGREEMVAFGRKPRDEDPTAFQGTYSKYVLFLGDEACYIPETLLDAADTLIGNEFSKIALFGNPDDPTTEFAKVCTPGSGWNIIRVGYEDTPNFTGEDVPQEVKDALIGPTWVEEKKNKWGENSPMYISKVLGKFPQHVTDGLIPIAWIQAAQERDLPRRSPIELGVDVGGGANRSVISARYGGFVRTIHKDNNPDTMQTLSTTLDAIRSTGASKAKVDYIGIGHGAVDRAREMHSDQAVNRDTPQLAANAGKVIGVEVGRTCEKPEDKEQYLNLRAKGYWELRERFNPANPSEDSIDIDPTDEDLAAQLSAIKYKRSAGRIQIESKQEMMKRGIASPDEADSVMLAFLDVEEEEDNWITF